MNTRYLATALAMLISFSSVNIVSAATFEPVKQVFVSDDSDRDFLSDAMDPGTLDDEGDIVVRERRDTSQDNIQIRTFLEFDLSSLTPDNVADPGFSATFSVDFVTPLNGVNDMGVLVGRVLDDGINGDSWDITEPDLPLFDWARNDELGEEFAADPVIVINNIKTDPLGTYSADVTTIVRDWVSGTFDNNGFVLYGTSDEFQGAGLNNAQLVTGLLGDFDENGIVDQGDFAVLAGHLAAHLDGPVTSADGDMDLDGDVDLDDFGLFKGVFPAGGAQAQSIPEPGTALLGAMAAFGLLLIRRRCIVTA